MTSSVNAQDRNAQDSSRPRATAPENITSTAVVSGDRYEDILAAWRSRLAADFPDQPAATQEAIAQWLVGEPERFEPMAPKEIKLAKRAMDYR